jgi:hypothetical protein
MQPDTSDNNPGATTTQVLRRFRVVFNAVRSHFQQVENRVGLGGAQVWALALVRDQPSIGMGELAKSMDIHQSTASNLIKILLRKAFIRQDKAPGDRRNYSFCDCMKRSNVASVKRNHRFWSARNLA